MLLKKKVYYDNLKTSRQKYFLEIFHNNSIASSRGKNPYPDAGGMFSEKFEFCLLT